MFLFFAVPANSSVSSEKVAVLEGRSASLSCTSRGVPTPTISWRFRDMVAPIHQNDTFTDFSAVAPRSSHLPIITLGRVVSNLQLNNIQYPTNDGVYVCVGSNRHGNVLSFSSVNISVLVLGKHACTMFNFVLISELLQSNLKSW